MSQVWVYILAAFARKFGQSGLFTIYQGYALDELNLSLPRSGIGGAVYGAAAVVGAALIALTHAFKLNYNKLVSLIVSALMNGVAIILVSIAKDNVSMKHFIGSFYITGQGLKLLRGVLNCDVQRFVTSSSETMSVKQSRIIL